jgi:transcriptional regulator with XRE-family HTH domain
MSPLDTGSTTHTLRLVDPLERARPRPKDYQTLGQYLRAVREHNGVTIAELSAATRVRKLYLQAIELGDMTALPSRPFAIGYVRAYAKALGLDEERMAARFKSEAPVVGEALRSPTGIRHDRGHRRHFVVVLILILVAGVVGWNLMQRKVAAPAMQPPSVSTPPADAPAAPTGPIALGAATPPPSEQTTPAPYQTPGLFGPADPAKAVAPSLLIAAPAAGARLPLFPGKPAVYGAPEQGATVLIQAIKPASLIIRGEGGVVYFARQLAAGESYRAPVGQRLNAEAADPGSLALFVAGRWKGSLTSLQTPVDKAVTEVAARDPAVAAFLAPPPPPAPVVTTDPAVTTPAPVAAAPAPVAAQ